MSKLNKLKNLGYDIFTYTFVFLICASMLIVPAAVVVWGIRWILLMTGVIV